MNQNNFLLLYFKIGLTFTTAKYKINVKATTTQLLRVGWQE